MKTDTQEKAGRLSNKDSSDCYQTSFPDRNSVKGGLCNVNIYKMSLKFKCLDLNT